MRQTPGHQSDDVLGDDADNDNQSINQSINESINQ